MRVMENEVKKLPMDWRIAYNEQAIHLEFLKQRNLTLAHQLAAAQAVIDELSNPHDDMVKEADGVSK